MAKFSIYFKNVSLFSELMLSLLQSEVTTDQKVAPGQIRKNNEWYFLTYLRIVVIKNFEPSMWDLKENEISCVRATAFKFNNGKLIVNGGKSEMKEVMSYFDAMALKLSANEPGNDGEVNFEKFYKLDDPIVDLGKILSGIEDQKMVADIKKLRMKDVEIKLGVIDNCIVSTNDYGGARKAISEDDALGVEVNLNNPADTTIYFDIDGQVRVTSKNPDVDAEKLAIELVDKI